ncbi:hypothetical protein DU508_09965 [Pedobacter chinensis]|uniref:Uncharacterized protein n=1 Tax=Pedobacter chinensis TaxID=2282421 RepID=A0A369Q203_9SPHI|nr:hypothetical protein DU508_09965 [Pedobacter chinensis]
MAESFSFIDFNPSFIISLVITSKTLKIIADREFLWENLLKDVGWALFIMSIGYINLNEKDV